MAKEPKRIDISRIPELLNLVQEVLQTNEPRILREGPAAKRGARGKPTSADDPLWKLVGIGHSGKSDISANKYKYLANAYRAH